MSSLITKIEFQKKNKARVNIYMDGEYAFACDAQLVYIHNITKGRDMDKESLENIVNEDNYIKGKTCALHFLERSFKSTKQVIDKLTMKEFDVKTIERVMDFLSRYDFIDDSLFIKLYIKEKIRSCGKNKIKFALLKKFLPKELINEELNKITSEQLLETALKLANKKIVTLAKSEKDSQKLYKKTTDYLVRSGYDYELIRKVMDEITSNDKEDDLVEGAPLGKGEVYEETPAEDYNELYELASKRYNILIKSETENMKIYKKLGDYLLRRGFKWEQIKKVLKSLINGVEDE
ncbi:recombination regulator RecX [Clostridium estertheticum]|uniref:Regulatory protein RecX n=1 Tax=Clostridium estertheticum TaxID=238834 RepID=A0AA47I753_9CLOT|nr:recombination regulator RecX [Clostridium estertheticum]MBU3155512.1 recombination regulator RecX [Clostridium estertheticum]MBU3199596.1 recombination regulator RecX [Clostridium estertheticum]WAG60575.1 recombination regulator RecX [Clostridium estertheticum]WAG65333.1 recombination regulator RecX [Clostridium estertheticum]